MHRYTPRAAFFMALCLLFAVPCDLEPAHSQESGVDKARYALAVAHCRGDVERPISLSADRQTLCFDGVIPDDLDFSQVNDLKNNGLFVVRSNGGFAGPAIGISNLLDAKRATVVAYDYCLSACANYFFFASARTYVFEKTIVAFHYGTLSASDCALVGSTRDNEDRRLLVEPCSFLDLPGRFGGWKEENEFYDKRVLDRQYGFPPQSAHIRKYLRTVFEHTGKVPRGLWMWNPRFYRTAVKTEICYENYPESQSEVDELAARFRLGPFIYDP
jgi:hypothetical protein